MSRDLANLYRKIAVRLRNGAAHYDMMAAEEDRKDAVQVSEAAPIHVRKAPKDSKKVGEEVRYQATREEEVAYCAACDPAPAYAGDMYGFQLQHSCQRKEQK